LLGQTLCFIVSEVASFLAKTRWYNFFLLKTKSPSPDGSDILFLAAASQKKILVPIAIGTGNSF